MIDKLLGLQNQLRMYHWQTTSFSEHKALGKAYDTLDELIDTFVETWMGIHGKVSVAGGIRMTLLDYASDGPDKLLAQATEFFTTGELGSALNGNTDLANIRDEMLGTVNRTKYLLTLE
jgi:hypothetical protein